MANKSNSQQLQLVSVFPGAKMPVAAVDNLDNLANLIAEIQHVDVDCAMLFIQCMVETKPTNLILVM